MTLREVVGVFPGGPPSCRWLVHWRELALCPRHCLSPVSHRHQQPSVGGGEEGEGRGEGGGGGGEEKKLRGEGEREGEGGG